MLIRRYLWITLFFMILSVCGIQVKAQEENIVNKGIVVRDAKLYAAASEEAACIGRIKEGTSVQIISVLSRFVIIKQDDIYAYLSYQDIRFDTDYEKQLGHSIPYRSPYGILVTEGRIHEQAPDIMMKAYLKVPEKVRSVFEEQGFQIKMTEWDVAEEAYAPYGGYHGIGKVKAVFDYERKMLFVNDEWPEEIVHEMGHFVNDFLKMHSSLSENIEMYRTECSKISFYAEENEREFFAEAFRLYILEPNLLELISHNIYAMVENSIGALSEEWEILR